MCLVLFYVHDKTMCYTETPVTVTPSSILSTPAKSIVTTAPSMQGPTISTTSNIPPLKQKTGIVKSKVPPPVPPRGSPRDRRGGGSQKSGISPRGTPPSSGSLNYLNDKYFDFVRPNSNNSCKIPAQTLHPARSRSVTPQPIFGSRRSPTCVKDWLEINDFTTFDYDEKIVECKITQPPETITLKPKRPLPFKTAVLQRENSFKSLSHSSRSSVRSMVKTFSSQNIERPMHLAGRYAKPGVVSLGSNTVLLEKTNVSFEKPNENVLKGRVHSYQTANTPTFTIQTASNKLLVQETHALKGNISNLRKTFENYPDTVNTDNRVKTRKIYPETRAFISTQNHSPSVNDKSFLRPVIAETFRTNDSFLRTLKPARRRPVDKKNVESVIEKKKQVILQNMSTLNLSADPRKYADSFSLDGEFV